MAAQRLEISLRVLKTISQVSAPFELFYDEFKVTKCCTSFFPRAGLLCLVKCDEGRFSGSVFTSSRKP